MKSMSIDEKAREEIAKQLAEILADTYVLYVKTQNFHWNLVDPRFYSLHLLFEKQYEELADAVDDLAERIRMLGHQSPGSLKEFLSLSTLKEANANISGDEMIRALYEDHVTIGDKQRLLAAQIQEKDDEGTADLLIARLRSHEQSAWFLRSHL